MDFDSTKQYGDFIEIVPVGEFCHFFGRVLAGDWNETNIKKVTDVLTEEYKEFIPTKLHEHVNITKHGPVDDGDPLHKTGTVCWKYTPEQKIKKSFHQT